MQQRGARPFSKIDRHNMALDGVARRAVSGIKTDYD